MPPETIVIASEEVASKHDHAHGHSHGTIDPVLLTTQQGIAAIKWSTVVLLITALVQFAIVLISGSVALLADTIHNLADAATGLNFVHADLALSGVWSH